MFWQILLPLIGMLAPCRDEDSKMFRFWPRRSAYVLIVVPAAPQAHYPSLLAKKTVMTATIVQSIHVSDRILSAGADAAAVSAAALSTILVALVSAEAVYRPSPS